jgi:glycosyltransferase involved in cell wall biosynthesis
MAGHGPLRPALEAQARTIPGLAVNFPGEIPQDEVQKLMLQHHTFAFTAAPPSHNQQEGTPSTLLQAMSLGRLVLAAATGGVTDQLQHNQSGLLYDPNHPEQLAHLLLQALAKDDLHTHLAKGALKAASAASWTALANELDHLKDQRFG